MTEINFQPLTQVENFSLTSKLTSQMAQWNHSSHFPKFGPMAARVAGCVLVIFTALGDTFLHMTLTIGKTIVSLSMLAFKLCFHISRDLDIASPLIHLIRTIRSVVNMVLLPFLCLLDPDRAYRITQTSYTPEKQSPKLLEVQSLNQTVEKLNGDVLKLTEDLNVTKNSAQRVREEMQTYKQANEKINERLQQEHLTKEQEIQTLQEQHKTLTEQLIKIRQNLQKNSTEAVEQIIRLEQNSRIQELNEQIANQQSQNLQAKSQIEALQAREKRAKDQIHLLRSQKNHLENQKNNLHLEIAENEEAYAQLKANQQNLLNRFNELTKLINATNDVLALMEETRMEKENKQKKLIEPSPQTPKVPPLPERENPVATVDFPENEFFNEPNKILQDLEGQKTPSDAPDANWVNTEEARKVVNDAHSALMDAIRNFDRLKNKTQDSVREADKLRFKLSAKHIRRIDTLFDRRSREALLTISRHITDMLEFCRKAEEEEAQFNTNDLSESVMDFGRSIIQGVNLADNKSEGLRNAIEYLENYSQYLKPRLEKLRDEQRQQNEKNAIALDQKRQEEAAQEKERKRKEDGLLTKEEALLPLNLIKGEVKKYANEPGKYVDVMQDLSSGNKKTKAEFYLKVKTGNKIENLTQFVAELEKVRNEINTAPEFYKPNNQYRLLKGIVEWINDQEYLR